ncbi:aldo/keto reductase [Candidatus Bathyarchaeota archaeon]|nr:MAG: aldo/keto reductase [Candidatus Bathyarchaeota archaeon]
MRMVLLGDTGLKVSRLCIGTDYSEVYGSPEGEGVQIFLEGFKQGVNFWDTAESYGSYPAMRAALKQIDREEVVITGKSYGVDRREVERDLEDALRDIGTTYIDIFMLHAVDSMEDFRRRRDALDFLLEVKRRGVIKAVGVSTHSARVAWSMAEIPEIDVVLTVLNIRGLRLTDGDLDLAKSAVRRLYEAGKGVYLMKVLARGRLADIYEEALRYVFRIPYVHSISVGIKSLNELREAVRIANEATPELNNSR